MKKKYVSTINRFIYHESGEQIYTISYSNKQVDPRSNPMADIHIVDRIRILSVGVGIFTPAFIGGSIGPVTNIQDNFHVEISLNILSPLNTNMSKAFMIGLACKSVGVNRKIINST